MGISVVRDFDKLRRFNVEQLYDQHQSTPDNGRKRTETTEKNVAARTTKMRVASPIDGDILTLEEIENHDNKVESTK